MKSADAIATLGKQWLECDNGQAKQLATRRREAVDQFLSLRRNGLSTRKAAEKVARAYPCTTRAVHYWVARVKDWPEHVWTEALLTTKEGTPAEISPDAWEMIKADYLRKSRPSMTSCVRRAKREGRKHGWEIPSTKTILRKLRAEVPEAAIVYAREGSEALDRLYPAVERDHSFYEALQAVNADGHRFDVFTQWEDGTVGRPVLVAWQDIYSGKILSWRLGQTESSEMIRLSFGDMVEDFGIPEDAFLDNGRGFMSKWLTGGMKTRFRFKVQEDEPLGIFLQMGVEVHPVTPYRGQAKPIERAFRDLCDSIAKHPLCEGAYTGRNPVEKPENYGTKTVPFSEFARLVDEEIDEHNARTGRRSKVCNGRSFDAAFQQSYAARLNAIRRPAEHQRRLWLLASEPVLASRKNGEVALAGNTYWTEELVRHRGERVVLRVDPAELHGSVWAYTLEGTLIGEALCRQAVGFGDMVAAREHNRQKRRWMRAQKEALDAARKMSAAEVANTLRGEPMPPADPQKAVAFKTPKAPQIDEDDAFTRAADRLVINEF